MTASAVDKRLLGARSKAHGEWFEGMIKAACDYYRYVGLADIEKTPEPMKILRPYGNGQFLACFEGAAQADFKGTLRGGRSVNFEAKHTDGEKMEQSRVTDVQVKKLDNTARMGGLCFVLCSFSKTHSFYRIPWEIWKDMKGTFGHKYFTPEEAKLFRVRTGGNGILMFLNGIKMQEGDG